MSESISQLKMNGIHRWSISFNSACHYEANRQFWVSLMSIWSPQTIRWTKNFALVDNVRFIVMNENTKRVLWRCSLMSTKTRKCPARIVMFKGNPPRFEMGQCRHEHMELTRGKFNQSNFWAFAKHFQLFYRKLQVSNTKSDDGWSKTWLLHRWTRRVAFNPV